MGSLKLLALAGALASVTASHAIAGDLPPPVAIPDTPTEAPSYGNDSGIYLRGDIGVGISTSKGLTADPTGTFNSFRVVDSAVTDSYFAGAGIGYAYNSWLRFDVTGEYRAGMGLRGHDRGNFGAGAGQDFFNGYDGDLRSAVGLVNAYVDLGTFCQLGCITPYVGAGVGMAYNWASVRDIGIVETGPGTNVFGPSGGYGDGHKSGLAWALMAGFGYQVNDKLTLDLGYRYLNLGDGPNVTLYNAVSGANDGSVSWRKLQSHDIRLGMRWTLGAGDCCSTPEQPLIRKY
jgi:opacity protein-like surface antigen